jgi:hypothetical protein
MLKASLAKNPGGDNGRFAGKDSHCRLFFFITQKSITQKTSPRRRTTSTERTTPHPASDNATRLLKRRTKAPTVPERYIPVFSMLTVTDKRIVLPVTDKIIVLPVTDKRIVLPVTDKRIVLPVTDKRIVLPVTDKRIVLPDRQKESEAPPPTPDDGFKAAS